MVVPVATISGALRIQATPEVLSVIAASGRTEDLRFSPSGRLIAIAGYLKNQIAVLTVDIRNTADGKTIFLERGVLMSSPALKKIHGLDFLDEDTIIAANRGGGVPLFRIPQLDAHALVREVQPIRELTADGVVGLDGPGSVVVSRRPGSCEVLICNNFSNTVTRHRLDSAAGYRPISTEVLLQKWFDIPDGISMSHDHEWLAVSQAGCGWVSVYANTPSLNAESDPSALLRQVNYPHGVKFSSCGRFLLVADAGAPYVQVFQRPVLGWYGVLHPMATWEVIGKPQFERGHVFPDEGGCKGLDLHPESAILATTCEFQTLVFYDVAAHLERLNAAPRPHASEFVSLVSHESAAGADAIRSDRDRAALEVAYELHQLSNSRNAVDAGIADLKRTWSWRITAPLRTLSQLVRRNSSSR